MELKTFLTICLCWSLGELCSDISDEYGLLAGIGSLIVGSLAIMLMLIFVF